jgi:hypothetical protein
MFTPAFYTFFFQNDTPIAKTAQLSEFLLPLNISLYIYAFFRRPPKALVTQ